MITKITRQLKALGIKIRYAPLDGNGFFGYYDSTPIIFINEQLDTITTAITLLHEVSHFLNEDYDKSISTYRQNNQIEYEANRYMIQSVLRLLDQEYDFTPHTNCYQITHSLSLPAHLDEMVYDELSELVRDKFGIAHNSITDHDYQDAQENAIYLSQIASPAANTSITSKSVNSLLPADLDAVSLAYRIMQLFDSDSKHLKSHLKLGANTGMNSQRNLF